MEKIIGTYTKDGQTIEYSITGKKGEPILMMHGGHSNCYEELGYDSLIKNGFMIITPSRAGYGSTSKEIGESLSKACEYYIELLHYLDIERVHVISVSAGGPSGIFLASHYPDRVKSLTLQSAVTKEWHTPKDHIYKLAQVIFHPTIEKITWKLTSSMSNYFSTFMFKQMAASFSELPYKQIKSYISDEDVNEVRKMNNRMRSRYGFLIDLSQTKEVTVKHLNAISVPTFIMHSKNDSAVSLEHAHYAHQQILNAELCILKTWGHLIWLDQGAEEVNAILIDFLVTYSKKD